MRTSGRESGVFSIKASIPGQVMKLLVTVGDVVQAEHPLVIMEAMKMQNELKASRPGTVSPGYCPGNVPGRIRVIRQRMRETPHRAPA